MSNPPIKTARLTPASAAMCKKADRELSSLLLMNRSAVTVLITTPTPATQLTVLPIVGSGWENLTYASCPIEVIAIKSKIQFANEARMVAFEKPYV